MASSRELRRLAVMRISAPSNFPPFLAELGQRSAVFGCCFHEALLGLGLRVLALV